MKWTREIGQKIGKLYLTNEKMSEGLKQAILEVAPEFPEKYFDAWFREAHLWVKGVPNTSAGPGTDYFLGFLDTAKELNYDISLIVNATKKWRSNIKRENAIKEWLIQNT